MLKRIFVVGSSRSGTTMMGRILSNHEDIANVRETHFFEQLWDPIGDEPQLGKIEALNLCARLLATLTTGYYSKVDINEFRDQATAIIPASEGPFTPIQIYTKTVDWFTDKLDKRISCEQTPRNVFYIQEMLEMLPDIRILIMVRDPRDVMLSQKSKWRRRQFGAKQIPRKQLLRFWANYHPITMSLLWNSAIKASLPFVDNPNIRFQSYEGLVKEPLIELQEICSFLGINYSEKLLNIPQKGSSHEPDKLEYGIDSRAAERWRSQIGDKTDIYFCEKLSQQFMTAFDYEFSHVRPNRFQYVALLLAWPLKSVLAFLLNVNRVSNLTNSLRRRFGKGI